eukprot:TRINITY_DN5991_c0_g3_i1.p1 TRINITY_DN5991_c0_g3~~TRINITY_DN5991_c0_g3_i1.p1  ORF type:complete len:144 (+),score=9.32 TRINITY_DN5991_c0_g3_i1:502-933(+)
MIPQPKKGDNLQALTKPIKDPGKYHNTLHLSKKRHHKAKKNIVRKGGPPFPHTSTNHTQSEMASKSIHLFQRLSAIDTLPEAMSQQKASTLGEAKTNQITSRLVQRELEQLIINRVQREHAIVLCFQFPLFLAHKNISRTIKK